MMDLRHVIINPRLPEMYFDKIKTEETIAFSVSKPAYNR